MNHIQGEARHGTAWQGKARELPFFKKGTLNIIERGNRK